MAKEQMGDGISLNLQQQEVIDCIEGSLMVMAPAGTGKTEVISLRTSAAINNGILPDKILCVTFTNRASKEMKKRITEILGKDSKELTIKTFHGLCYHIIRCESDHLGIDSDFTIYDEEDTAQIIKVILNDLGVKGPVKDINNSVRVIGEFIQKSKEDTYIEKPIEDLNLIYQSLVENERRSSYLLRDVDPMDIFNAYNLYLQENHALDFTDLITYTLQLFNDEKILKKWQGTYNWIQVDEVQDTNIFEYLILSMLAKEHGNLSFFGDIDQTIYEWRGSSPYSIIKRFKEEFSPVKEISFIENYRSTQNILNACSELIKQYPKRVTKQIECKAKDVGEKLKLHGGSTLYDETDWICNHIQELKDNDGLEYKDMAILTRSNFTNQQISQVLSRRNIPCFLVDEYKFFRRAEIKDAISYLKLLLNKYDSNSLFRVLKCVPNNIGEVTIRNILNIPNDIGLKLVDFIDLKTLDYGDPYELLLKKLSDGKVVIFDVESTGLDVSKDEIIEIAGVKVGEDGIIDKFHHLLKNTVPVGESECVHGFSDEYLSVHGKDPKTILNAFMEFIDDCILVGHNVYYDISILKSQLLRLGLGILKADEFYDTLDMTRRYYPGLNRYTLENLSKVFSINNKPTHHAMDDVEATKEILDILVKRILEYKLERQSYVFKYGTHFFDTAKRFEKWREDLNALRPHEILSQVLKESGMLDHLNKRQEAGRIDNLRELYRVLRWYDQEDLSSIEALQSVLALTALSSDADRYVEMQNKIPIITIHQAKGLEFNTVFLSALTDNDFPSYMSKQSGTIDEEHRLFYVGMTRAKRNLIFTYHYNNRDRQMEVSRFVNMIPTNLIQYIP